MTTTEKDQAEEEEAFSRGFHGIQSAAQLRAMSFVDLASLLSSCEKDSAKFLVVERELFQLKGPGSLLSHLIF